MNNVIHWGRVSMTLQTRIELCNPLVHSEGFMIR